MDEIKRSMMFIIILVLSGILILLVFLSNAARVTGNATADLFFSSRLSQGDPLTGEIRIRIDEVMPVNSIISLRVGDQIAEKPLFSLLDEYQVSKIEQELLFSPEVDAVLDFSVIKSGGITGFSTLDVAGSGEQEGGSGTTILYPATVQVSSSETKVSLGGNFRIIDVKVREAKLRDGTIIPSDLISADIAPDNSVQIVSNYKESVPGFRSGVYLRIPLEKFLFKAQIGSISVDLLYKNQSLVKASGTYVPVSSKQADDSAEIIFRSDDYTAGQSDGCGDTVCFIDECALPNSDSDIILRGDIKRELVTFVECRNFCGGDKRTYTCKDVRKVNVVEGVQEGNIKTIALVSNDTGEIVANLKAELSDRSVKRLDIIFSNS